MNEEKNSIWCQKEKEIKLDSKILRENKNQ